MSKDKPEVGDVCITSEQLTEQWKKGELPNGYYWIRLSWGGMVIMAYHTAFDGLFELDDHYYDSDEISEVLAPVPSYDEWQATETSIAYNELAKENEELKEILERHKKATAKAQIRSCDLEIINTYLKELLEECIPYFNALVEKRHKLEYIPQVYELLTKINEVLK